MRNSHNQPDINNIASGNLQMDHVGILFYATLRGSLQQRTGRGNSMSDEELTREFGTISWYSDQPDARNTDLNQEIISFISNSAPQPEGARNTQNTTIGNNRTIILLKCNSLRDIGTDAEQPDFRDTNSTHYTVLNLIKTQGGVGIKYSDSLGQESSSLPLKVKRLLEDHNIDTSSNNIQEFMTERQQGANCGFHAVYNALRMHNLVSQSAMSVESFINSSKDFLQSSIPINNNSRVGEQHNKQSPNNLPDLKTNTRRTYAEFREDLKEYMRDNRPPQKDSICRKDLKREGLIKNVPSARLKVFDLDKKFLTVINLQGENKKGINLEKANLYGKFLGNINLQEANLQGCDLFRANLAGANLQGADLREAELENANLAGADLQGADLRGAILNNANLQGQGANLQGVYLIPSASTKKREGAPELESQAIIKRAKTTESDQSSMSI